MIGSRQLDRGAARRGARAEARTSFGSFADFEHVAQGFGGIDTGDEILGEVPQPVVVVTLSVILMLPLDDSGDAIDLHFEKMDARLTEGSAYSP